MNSLILFTVSLVIFAVLLFIVLKDDSLGDVIFKSICVVLVSVNIVLTFEHETKLMPYGILGGTFVNGVLSIVVLFVFLKRRKSSNK